MLAIDSACSGPSLPPHLILEATSFVLQFFTALFAPCFGILSFEVERSEVADGERTRFLESLVSHDGGGLDSVASEHILPVFASSRSSVFGCLLLARPLGA